VAELSAAHRHVAVIPATCSTCVSGFLGRSRRV
jgi:hypothetical protein